MGKIADRIRANNRRASGTGFVVLGGPEARHVRVFGDIVRSIEHVNGQESICMWRARRGQGDGAFVLGVHSLGFYFDSTGLPTPEGMRRCADAMKVMGFSALDTFALRRLLDVIYESLHDVIHLAPQAREAVDLSGVDRLVLRADGDIIVDIK